MSRPPIKAMKAVQRYCAKQKSCEKCVLHTLTEYGYSRCVYSPAAWEIEKSKSEIVPDYRDGWKMKEGDAE